MILMIDWGNTNLKFIELTAIDKNRIDTANVSIVKDLNELIVPNGTDYELVLISSVRSPKHNQQLLDQLKTTYGLSAEKIIFAKTSFAAHGIACAYDDPSKLGIDRWLGVLAAVDLSENIGIISIGTAITLDVVINKQHLGGQILPGRKLMVDSLLTTGQVRPSINQANSKNKLLGRSTTDCVNLAIDSAIKAYLTNTMTQLGLDHQIDLWVITGGGAKVWQAELEALGHNVFAKPMLVFEGLLKYQSK